MPGSEKDPCPPAGGQGQERGCPPSASPCRVCPGEASRSCSCWLCLLVSTSDSAARPGTHFLRGQKRKPNEGSSRWGDGETWTTLFHRIYAIPPFWNPPERCAKSRPHCCSRGKGQKLSEENQPLIGTLPRGSQHPAPLHHVRESASARVWFPLTATPTGGRCKSGEVGHPASPLPWFPPSFLSLFLPLFRAMSPVNI